jgi:hypothetical protein
MDYYPKNENIENRKSLFIFKYYNGYLRLLKGEFLIDETNPPTLSFVSMPKYYIPNSI